MAEYVKFEGTTDFLVHYPALITTFTAANAISAGDWCAIANDGKVSGSGAWTSGSAKVVGLAVRTAAAGEKVAVIMWGLIKNVFAGNTVNQGDFVEAIGQNFVHQQPSTVNKAAIGRVFFGPAGATTAASGSAVTVFLSANI